MSITSTPTTATITNESVRAILPNPPVSLDPTSTYEVITRQMVEDLTREVTAIRQRVDSIFYLVIAAIIGNLLMRLV
jgi:hypothetical protein